MKSRGSEKDWENLGTKFQKKKGICERGRAVRHKVVYQVGFFSGEGDDKGVKCEMTEEWVPSLNPVETLVACKELVFGLQVFFSEMRCVLHVFSTVGVG
jgi:hypothetical protein